MPGEGRPIPGGTRMSLLEHPTAQALLADAEVSAADVAGCQRRLEFFLQRYLPRFYRVEQHELARVVLQGKLSNLQRKTAEPIAYQAGRHRKPVQHFVGAGCWDDEAVMAELRRRRLPYVLDVPCNTLVRDLSEEPAPGRRVPSWRRVDEWARLQPRWRW